VRNFSSPDQQTSRSPRRTIGYARILSQLRSYGSGTTSAASLLCSADRLGTTASGVLVEQCGEFLRREDPVALDYELTDLLPVRVVGEQHPDAITAGSRGEERVASG
jgi:hypothetical protein